MPAPSATRPVRRRAPPGGDPVCLVIRFLGEATATVDGRPLPELTGPRMQRLLTRVALAGEAGVPRERLAGEL